MYYNDIFDFQLYIIILTCILTIYIQMINNKKNTTLIYKCTINIFTIQKQRVTGVKAFLF